MDTLKTRIAAACERMQRRARLAHYQQLARIAQAPDYFEHVARRRRALLARYREQVKS